MLCPCYRQSSLRSFSAIKLLSLTRLPVELNGPSSRRKRTPLLSLPQEKLTYMVNSCLSRADLSHRHLQKHEHTRVHVHTHTEKHTHTHICGVRSVEGLRKQFSPLVACLMSFLPEILMVILQCSFLPNTKVLPTERNTNGGRAGERPAESSG